MKKILFIISALAFASCETVVNIDLPVHERKLVANSMFSPDTLRVDISHSIGMLDNSDIAMLGNATVEIWKDGIYFVTLPNQGAGVYYLPGVYAQAGSTYTLKTTAPGFDGITASSTVPSAIPISAYSITDSVIVSNGYAEAELSITFNDPSGSANYYELELFSIDTFYNSTKQVNIYPKNDESSTVESIFTSVLINDELINGNTFTVKVLFDSRELQYLAPPYGYGKMIARLKSVTPEYYLYAKTRHIQSYTGNNPFAEPVRVHSNIEGGFGIFAAYNTFEQRVR
jgi:hypothetical protein